MLNLISYSGGKDSGALALHLKEQGVTNLVLVFCDTQWEHPLTYRHAFEFARSAGLRLKVLGSEGMEALCARKKRAPSARARFCTEELKLKPFAAYVKSLHAQGFETVVWVGERAEESKRRAKLPCDEYSDLYDCIMARPLLRWTAKDVFDIHARLGAPLHPFYRQGFERVGCMPCCMARKGELTEIAKRYPEVFDRLAALEQKMGRTWAAPGTTPDRFASVAVEVEREEWERVSEDDDDNEMRLVRRYMETVWLATAHDLKNWATSDVKTMTMGIPFEPPNCASRYGLCG